MLKMRQAALFAVSIAQIASATLLVNLAQTVLFFRTRAVFVPMEHYM
jgi:hypothetical protein